MQITALQSTSLLSAKLFSSFKFRAFVSVWSDFSPRDGREILCCVGKMNFFCGALAALVGLQVVESQFPPPGGGNGGPPTGGGSGSGGGGAACDQCGSSASYSEKVVLDADYGFAVRQITTNGCPNHYSVCTGKQGLTGCGGVGVEGTATEAVMNSANGDGSTTISIPALPVFATSTTDIECELGAIAVALNGVGIFGGAVDSDCNMVCCSCCTQCTIPCYEPSCNIICSWASCFCVFVCCSLTRTTTQASGLRSTCALVTHSSKGCTTTTSHRPA